MNTKTLKISEELHTSLKIYCSINKLKINKFVEKLIENEIVKNDKK